MSEMWTIARLRWALTIATTQKSAWQLVGFILSVLLALQAVAGSWFVAILGGSDLGAVDSNLANTRVVLVCLGCVVTVFVVLIQLMVIGEGSTLNPQRFAYFGIPDIRLQGGLLLAGLVGLPSLCGLACFLAFVALYRSYGPVVIAVAVLAALLAVVTMMSLSKMLLSLATSLASSQRSQNLLYLVVFVLFFAMCYLPQAILPQDPAQSLRVQQMEPLANIFAFTPLAAAFQLPFDAIYGNWLLLGARLAILLVTCWLCFLVSLWCLRHARLSQGHALAQAKIHGLGAFAKMPDSPSGTISARLLIYMRRDPRQILFLLLPIIFLVAFSFQASTLAFMVWVAVFMGAVSICMFFANGLAYDGPGIHMQVLAGVSGKDDRIGRVRVALWISSIYIVAECLLASLISGYWRTSSGLLLSLILTCLAEGTLMAGIGLAQVFSCTLIYPVASIDRPFSSPQGRAMAQGLFPFLQLFGNLLLMLPTIIIYAALPAIGSMCGLSLGTSGSAYSDLRLVGMIAVVGLLNGLGVLWLGISWSSRIFERRQLNIVDTLDRYASQ